MDLITLTHYSEFAAASLMALLEILLLGLFLYAYIQCRRAFFLLLAVGALVFVYSNLIAAVTSFYAIARLRVLSPSTLRPLFAIYSVANPIGEILWFIGVILLVRFALRLHASRQI